MTDSASTTPPATHNLTPTDRLTWSSTEKSIARKAFDRALQGEFDAIIREAKQKAANVQQPSDLWHLEAWLTKRREALDSTYDYRYSVLPYLFARLIREGKLTLADLSGLREDKLYWIRGMVEL